MSQPQSNPAPQASKTSKSESAFFSPRARRQLGLFAAGAGFFLLSTAITRRSIIRRYKAMKPKFYQPSNKLNFEVNGAVEAAEALAIATLNVASVGIMATGGLAWAFDISSVEDMRRQVRTNMGVDVERTDQAAEEEIEEWFASVLARKEFKALRGDFGIKDDGTKDERSTKNQSEDRHQNDDQGGKKS